MDLFQLDWPQIRSHLILLGIAYLLALPIGLDRERHARSAGLRTFPLVALASCGFMLVGIEAFATEEAPARILAGVISGMGFIGGGAILKGNGVVTGTATAAGLWTTGAIGIAVAWQRIEIALVLSMFTFLTLTLVPSIAKPMTDDSGAAIESESKAPD